LPDPQPSGTDQVESVEDALQPFAGNDHVRRVGGQRRGGTEGDAKVGGGKGGRVVAAVADHRHRALRLQTPDDGRLALGRHPGEDLVNPVFIAAGMLGAGQQHDLAMQPEAVDDIIPFRP